jgi:hypothetical protein
MKNMKSSAGFYGTMIAGFVFLSAVTGHAQAQRNTVSHTVRLSVAEIAVLGMDDSNPLDLTVVPSALRRLVPAGADSATRTLRYTTVNSAGTTRSIFVSTDNPGNIPEGTSLKIAATSVPVGCGVKTSEITLDGQPKSLITDIPSSATGVGGQGAVLQYRFVIDDESSLVAGSKAEITLIYTITES